MKTLLKIVSTLVAITLVIIVAAIFLIGGAVGAILF